MFCSERTWSTKAEGMDDEIRTTSKRTTAIIIFVNHRSIEFTSRHNLLSNKQCKFPPKTSFILIDKGVVCSKMTGTAMDDSNATINEAIQLVEDRLASRVSIVFSHDFLQEFPSSAQAYFIEGISTISIESIKVSCRVEAKMNETDNDETDDDSSSSSSSVSIDDRADREQQQQHRCIKQMGKLTKVKRFHPVIFKTKVCIPFRSFDRTWRVRWMWKSWRNLSK